MNWPKAPKKWQIPQTPPLTAIVDGKITDSRPAHFIDLAGLGDVYWQITENQAYITGDNSALIEPLGRIAGNYRVFSLIAKYAQLAFVRSLNRN